MWQAKYLFRALDRRNNKIKEKLSAVEALREGGTRSGDRPREPKQKRQRPARENIFFFLRTAGRRGKAETVRKMSFNDNIINIQKC